MYCISCLQKHPESTGTCPECEGELFAYSPTDTLQGEVEKRHFLLGVLRESEQQGLLTKSQRDKIGHPHQEFLLRYRNEIMEELGLFDEAPAPEAPVEASTQANEEATQHSSGVLDSTAPETGVVELVPQASASPGVAIDSAQEATPAQSTPANITDAVQAHIEVAEETKAALSPQYESLKAALLGEKAAASTKEPAISPANVDDTGETGPSRQVRRRDERESDLLDAQSTLGEGLDGKSVSHDADPLSMPDFEEDGHYSDADRAVMEQSAWSKYLKPFLVQNWLYFLGTFLVLASGFYLLSLAWEGMHTTLRQSVIWGGLGTTALAFAGGGAYLHRKLGVDQAGQIFWMVGAGLLGSSAIAAGQAARHSTLVFVLLVMATIGISLWLIRLLKPFDRGFSRQLTAVGMAGQLFLIAMIPALKLNQHARFWIFSFFYIGGFLLWQSIRQLRGTLQTNGGGVMSRLISWRPARPTHPEEEGPNRWDWILFVGPVAYLFALMLGWAGWELSTVLQRRMALSWYGPLLVLMGGALLEFLFAASPTLLTQDNEETSDEANQAQDKSAQEGPKEAPVSSWIGGAIALGVVGVFVAFPHPPAQFFASTLLCMMSLYIGSKWPKQGVFFLAGTSGLFGYVGALRTITIEGIWSAELYSLTHGLNGLLFLPFLAVLFIGILWYKKTHKTEGTNAFRGLFLLLSLALFGIMALDASQNPQYLMWGAPIYALAYLAIAHFNEKQVLGYLGLLMAGFWFGYGPTQWFSLHSKFALSMLAFGVSCFAIARLVERQKAEGALRRVLDDGVILALVAAMIFWVQDPLFRFFHLEKALRGAGGGPWQPEGVWMLVYIGFVLYGALIIWSTRNTGNPLTAYLALGVIALGAGLLGVATPRWLGREIVPWRAPMFATIGTFVLFELSRRITGGVREQAARLSLFGHTSGSDGTTLWARPARQFSYGLLFASVVLVGLRDLTVTVQLIFVYALFAFVFQAGVRQGQRRFGYLLSVFYWLVGFLQLSWIDERMHLDPTLGYIIFFGGGCLVLSVVLWGTRRWTSPEGETTRWTAISGPLANLLPLFLVFALVWQFDQSRLWVLGRHPEPGYLFLGWLILTLSFYSLASVLRQAMFVYAGALSFAGMGLLLAHKMWSPLELLCASTGMFAFLYAVGVMRIWRRFGTPHQISGVWQMWQFKYRDKGEELWGHSHREVALFFGFWSIPGLFLTWLISLYISTGSEMMQFKAVGSWVVMSGALLAAFPFLWEGYLLRNRSPLIAQKRFSVAVFAMGMGLALGSSAWLTAMGLDPESPATWAVMLAEAAFAFQVAMWFCRFKVPELWRIFEAPARLLLDMMQVRNHTELDHEEWWQNARQRHPGTMPDSMEETSQLFGLWGRLWKASHRWFVASACFSTCLAAIALAGSRGQESTYLAVLLIPLALELLQRPSRVGLTLAMLLAAFFWSTNSLPTGLTTTGIVLLSMIFLWKSHRQWDNAPLRSLFWLSVAMIAIAFGGCILVLDPMPSAMQAPMSWSGWCIALSVIAIGCQGWMWFCRRRGAGFAIPNQYQIDPQEADEIEPTLAADTSHHRLKQNLSLQAKSAWEGLWYASLTCFGLTAALAGLCTYSAVLAILEPGSHWMLRLLPFVAMLPWVIDQVQRPVKDTFILVILFTSMGIYLTSALLWQGTAAEFILPGFAVAFFWLLMTHRVVGFFLKRLPQERLSFYMTSALAVPVPLLLLGLFVWCYSNYQMYFAPHETLHLWLRSPWAQVGVPLLYLWMALTYRLAWTFNAAMLVWFCWPLGFVHWLVGDWTTWSPALVWALFAFGLGILFHLGRKIRPDTSEEVANPEQTEKKPKIDEEIGPFFYKAAASIAFWVTAMGVVSFVALMNSAQSADKAAFWPLQWFGTAALITVGWGLVALSRGDSSRWLLQASLAGIWSVHGVFLLVLPTSASILGVREPGLFALLSALFVVVVNAAAILVSKGGLPRLWQPLVPIYDQDAELAEVDMKADREYLWRRVASALNTTALSLTILASILVGLAWFFRINSYQTHLLTDITVLLSLVLLAWNWVRIALFRQMDLPAYLGVICFFGLYAYVRSAIGVGSAKMDTWLLMVLGFVSVGFRIMWQRMGGELLQRVIFRVTFVLPVIVFLVTTASAAALPQGFWLLAGLFYGVVAQQYDKRILYVPALILVNVELFRLLSNVIQADPFTNPQWYALPFGFTLFAFSAIYKGQLHQNGRNILRNIGAIAIYACSMYQVVALNNIMDIMLLALLAIAGVIAGIILQVRSYLYLGAVFLVLDISINLFRIGINDRIIGMVFLFVTGLLVLASAVFFNLKRDELLRKYTEWRSKIADWD